MFCNTKFQNTELPSSFGPKSHFQRSCPDKNKGDWFFFDMSQILSLSCNVYITDFQMSLIIRRDLMRICSSSAWFQGQLTLESPRSTPKPNLKQGTSVVCFLFTSTLLHMKAICIWIYTLPMKPKFKHTYYSAWTCIMTSKRMQIERALSCSIVIDMTFGLKLSKVTRRHDLFVTLHIDINRLCTETWFGIINLSFKMLLTWLGHENTPLLILEACSS